MQEKGERDKNIDWLEKNTFTQRFIFYGPEYVTPYKHTKQKKQRYELMLGWAQMSQL